MGKKIDLTGQRFGMLTVLFDTGERSHGSILWHCKCDCGNECNITSCHLKSNHTTSCGCKKQIDLTGQKFGMLTVLYNTKKRESRHIVWHCICDCGNECDISSRYLTNGHTASCGCINSKGELKIKNILKENNILFDSQKTFSTCKFKDTNRLAFFDFFINNKYLLEYDGIQHFTYKNSGWNTKENFEKTQSHDEYKTQWCKDNNIPLIRIPYTKFDTLCIDDLLLETTAFRIA